MFVGDILGAVVTPLVMLVLYFLILSPIAILCRVFGRDVFLLRKSTKTVTFWETSEVGNETFQQIDFETQF